MTIEHLQDASNRENRARLVYSYDLLLQRNKEQFHMPSQALQQLRDNLGSVLRLWAVLYIRMLTRGKNVPGVLSHSTLW